MRRVVLGIVVACLLVLPAPALAAFGDQEIPVFRVTPSTKQAGAHPEVSLFFRFCDRGLDIVDVTNTSPIVVTTAEPHGINSTTFTSVRILGVEGTTAANGDWNLNLSAPSNVINPTQFSLPGSTGNGPTSQARTTRRRSPHPWLHQHDGAHQITAKLKDFKLHLPPGSSGTRCPPTSVPPRPGRRPRGPARPTRCWAGR